MNLIGRISMFKTYPTRHLIYTPWNWVTMGLVALAVVLLVVLLVRNRKRTNVVQAAPTVNSQALDALKMKYAQGDMTEEEYLRRKEVLSEG